MAAVVPAQVTVAYEHPFQNFTSTSTIFAPCLCVSSTAAKSFMRKMRHSGVTIMVTEFFSTAAYLLCLGSLTAFASRLQYYL
jgi:hypothetical protein